MTTRMIKIDNSLFKLHKMNGYAIVYNLNKGKEILSGVDGNEDPFYLAYPSMLDIGVMGHCINNCKMCYQGDNAKPNMKLEDFKEILRQTRPYIMQVALGGRGDPNLHENFEDILRACRASLVAPNYTTSGNGLTAQQIRFTKAYCGAVAVSNYDKDFTYSAIERFIEIGMKTNIHFVLSNQSFDDAISLIQGKDVWNGKVNIDKLNAVVFLSFKPQGRGKDLDWNLTVDQIKTFAEEVKTPKSKFKIGMDSCMVCKIGQVREFTPSEQIYADTCEGSRMSAYISPDMKFLPCSFGDDSKYGIPITKDMGIKEIWDNSKVFCDFRNELVNNPSRCPFGF